LSIRDIRDGKLSGNEFLHRPAEGRAMAGFAAHEFIPGVGMRVDMDHAERAVSSDGPENRQGDRMIAPRRERHDASLMELRKETGDVSVSCSHLINPGEAYIAPVANPAQFIRIYPRHVVNRAHHAGGVAHFARAVPCARPVRDRSVVGDSDHGNVKRGWISGQRCAHEGWNLHIAGRSHGAGGIGICRCVIGHFSSPQESLIGSLCCQPVLSQVK